MGLFKYLKEKFKKNDDKKGESSSEQPKKIHTFKIKINMLLD